MKMGKYEQEELSSHNLNFFRVIVNEIIAQGTLELPRFFVMEHGKHLSNYVRLKVPTGEESKMELKWRNDRAWLHKGWQDFVDKYSIRCGYFLVFFYRGESRFNVIIMDLSTTEIKYPVSSTKTSTNKKAGKRKLIHVKEEDDYGDEILDEYRETQLAKDSGKSRSGQEEHFTLIKHKSVSGDQVIAKNGVGNARERVVERARAFESPNPHFTVIIQPSYVSMSQLYVHAGPTRPYFYEKEDKKSMCLVLKGEDGQAWSVKYTIGPDPRRRLRFGLGWAQFVQENHLRVGDVCAFELVNKRAITFKVTIFRIADEEEQVDKNHPLLLTDVASRANKTFSSVTLDAMERVRKRAESFKCKNPHFMIRMTSFYTSNKSRVHIPSAHSRRYLKEDENGRNLVILHGSNGETWPVHYYHTVRSSRSRTEFVKGWKDFASDNRLRVGDICVFEKMTGKAKAYKVTILTLPGATQSPCTNWMVLIA